MIADIARIRILAVDDHPVIRSALWNEPEPLLRKSFLQKWRKRVQARRPGNQNGNLCRRIFRRCR